MAGQGDCWEAETYSLDAYAASTIQLRFRYITDGGVSYRGWEVTDINVGRHADDVGFTAPTPAISIPHGLAAGRRRGRRDVHALLHRRVPHRTTATTRALARTATSSTATTRTWVDWYPYNTGLHLIYRDTFSRTTTSATHLGEGGWMVVDAQPMPDIADDVRRLPGTGGRASRCATRPSALSPTAAEHLLRRLRPGVAVGESAAARQAPPSRGSTTAASSGSPRRPRPGLKIDEARRAHQRSRAMDARRHDDLRRQT